MLPLKNSPHSAAGKGHSHCCCPAGELYSGSFAFHLLQSLGMNHAGPPILTPDT